MSETNEETVHFEDTMFSVATNREVMTDCIKAVWPLMQQLRHPRAGERLRTVSTQELKEAIGRATGQEVCALHTVNAGHDPFAPAERTIYGESMPFFQALTIHLRQGNLERATAKARKIWEDGSAEPFILGKSLRDAIMDHVAFPLVGDAGFRDHGTMDWPYIPRSAVMESIMSTLYWFFLYAALDDEGGLWKIRPLLGFLSHVVPMGQLAGEPRTWCCAIIRTPISLRP